MKTREMKMLRELLGHEPEDYHPRLSDSQKDFVKSLLPGDDLLVEQTRLLRVLWRKCFRSRRF